MFTDFDWLREMVSSPIFLILVGCSVITLGLTIERLRYDAPSNRLRMEIEHYDPTFFTRDFELSSAEYVPSELELQPFNCRPENPDHTLQ